MLSLLSVVFVELERIVLRLVETITVHMIRHGISNIAQRQSLILINSKCYVFNERRHRFDLFVHLVCGVLLLEQVRSGVSDIRCTLCAAQPLVRYVAIADFFDNFSAVAALFC